MSVCDCGWYGDEITGACILGGGPRTCRTAGKICPNCQTEVKVGQRCIDHAGIWEDTGWCSKYHAECFELMELFADKFCGGDWTSPFDLVEAAGHAVSQGDNPFWREWLYLYEKTWEWTEEPPDPEPIVKRVWEMALAMRVPFFKAEALTSRRDIRLWKEVK